MNKLKLPKKYTPEKSYSTPIRIRKSTQNLLDTVAEETGWNKIDVVEKNDRVRIRQHRMGDIR